METLSYCQLMERCLAAEARVVELAAENVVLKESVEHAAGCISAAEAEGLIDALEETTDERLADLVHRRLCRAYLEVETSATDRIVAGIKADGVEEVLKIMGGFSSDECGDSVYFEVQDFAKQLRESAK